MAVKNKEWEGEREIPWRVDFSDKEIENKKRKTKQGRR